MNNSQANFNINLNDVPKTVSIINFELTSVKFKLTNNSKGESFIADIVITILQLPY